MDSTLPLFLTGATSEEEEEEEEEEEDEEDEEEELSEVASEGARGRLCGHSSSLSAHFLKFDRRILNFVLSFCKAPSTDDSTAVEGIRTVFAVGFKMHVIPSGFFCSGVGNLVRIFASMHCEGGGYERGERGRRYDDLLWFWKSWLEMATAPREQCTFGMTWSGGWTSKPCSLTLILEKKWIFDSPY